jgi:hypothetical protein
VCLFTAISYGQWVFFLSFFSVFRKLLSVVFFLNGLGEFEEIGWRVNDAGANGGFLLGFFMLRFSLFFFSCGWPVGGWNIRQDRNNTTGLITDCSFFT